MQEFAFSTVFFNGDDSFFFPSEWVSITKNALEMLTGKIPQSTGVFLFNAETEQDESRYVWQTLVIVARKKTSWNDTLYDFVLLNLYLLWFYNSKLYYFSLCCQPVVYSAAMPAQKWEGLWWLNIQWKTNDIPVTDFLFTSCVRYTKVKGSFSKAKGSPL